MSTSKNGARSIDSRWMLRTASATAKTISGARVRALSGGFGFIQELGNLPGGHRGYNQTDLPPDGPTGGPAMHDVLRQRLLRRIESLPEEQIYQVLDFIEFLESKYARDLKTEATGLQKFAEGLEDKL